MPQRQQEPSGAAGLIYQVVWSRELVLVFGNTTQAISTIVTAFMLGLGLGSLAGGMLSGDPGRPTLLLFSGVELGIGIFGFDRVDKKYTLNSSRPIV